MKAYELLTQIKDLCLYSSSGTSRDNLILQRLNMVQQNLYNMAYYWRALEAHQDLYTTELMTLDVAPSTPWAVGDTITGATSAKTCVVVDVLTTTTFNVKSRSGTYTLDEVLSNGTYTADQGTSYPTFSRNAFSIVPSDMGLIFDMRQMTSSPYAKLDYIHPRKFHALIPQPTVYAEGKPRFYTWWAGRIWWYPIPDSTYTITLYYYKKPTGLKLYSTGTAVVSGAAVTGTSTFFSTNSNVAAGMFFTLTGDILNDGTYAWAEVGSVGSITALTLKTAYAGGGSGTSYACSSAPIFPAEFDNYLIYAATLMEISRHREMATYAQWLQKELVAFLSGLISNQTKVPDYTPVAQDFGRDPILLGDDYAKFPFIRENL